MLADAASAFFHFAALIMMVGALFGELFVMRLPVTAQTIPLLARIDRAYGLSAGALIAAGLARVYFGLKDESFYFASHAFAAKMAVFIVIGVISVWPTMKFLRWNKAAKADGNFVPPEAEVRSTRTQLRIQAVLLSLVVLFAVLMARGLG
jgi:putative membrane protein